MLVVLPLIPFAFTLMLFRSRIVDSWRGAMMGAAVAWALMLTATTELLSAFTLISYYPLAAAWLLISAASAALYAVWGAPLPKVSFAEAWSNLPRDCRLFLSGLAGALFLTGVAALFSPPNNFDSMTYHMARVANWIQNGTVAHYQTDITRQLFMSPWAEFAIVHLQILSGGDRFANLIQWLGYAGVVIGVSAIARQLGADRRGQVLAAVVAATIPMAILQASSTQNDLVTAFWITCFAYFILAWTERSVASLLFIAAGSMGLAVLTKGTAYLYAPMAVLAAPPLWKFKWRLAPQIAAGLFVVLLIDFGHYARNEKLFGSPLGPDHSENGGPGVSDFVNSKSSVPVLISNLVRNVALHLSTPWRRVNHPVFRSVEKLHAALGIPLNDPASTFSGTHFEIAGLTRHEDYAGNPLHFALIVGAIVLLLWRRTAGVSQTVAWYSLALASVFILFCFHLKWQPWNSRLHLPMFALWAAPIATVISRRFEAGVAKAVACALLVAAMPPVLKNQSRPLLVRSSVLRKSRTDLYFQNWPDLGPPYINAVQLIKDRGCRQVGLETSYDDWEYPLWVLMSQQSQPFHIVHMEVSNESSAATGQNRSASANGSGGVCAIVSINNDSRKKITTGGAVYARSWSSSRVSLYIRM